VLTRVDSGGEQPAALALAPDGKTLAVANSFSGSIGVISVQTQKLVKRISLRGMPQSVAIAPSGLAFVAVNQLDQVAVVDLQKGEVVKRIEVGRHPSALTLTADGNRLLCANMGGTLSVIDTQLQTETARISVPAMNLRGLTVAPNGKTVWLTGQQPHNDQPTERPESLWSNVLLTISLTDGGGTVERVLNLDKPDYGAADPCGVALDARNETAFVTLTGTHEVALVPAESASGMGASSVRPAHRIPVGCCPSAIVLRPNTTEFWIADQLGNALTIVPAARFDVDKLPAKPRRIVLDAPTFSPSLRLRGRFLFASAHLTRGRHFSCETCHPNMGSDGLNWKFIHVKDDGLDQKATRDLRGNLLMTAPYGWGGRDEDFEVFVNHEVVGLLRTRKLVHSEVHALWDLVNETPPLPNPHRTTDNKFTVAALRGQKLFEGKAACIKCHEGEQSGGTAKTVWIGTTPPNVKLDVPHLESAYDTAPYLHDSSAATLEEVFSKRNAQKQHGDAHLLTPAEMKDLLQYVREL
jgi:YVTN family beta-propeller protein